MGLGILDVTFTNEKEHLNECVKKFNELCEQGMYPSILEWTPFELFMKSPGVSTSKWKEFLLEPTIVNWYASERKLLLQSQVNKLIREAGTSRSTASAQALGTLLKQLNETETTDSSTIFVYTFVPLTEQERKAPNVNVNNNIPDSIKNSVQIIKRNTINLREE